MTISVIKEMQPGRDLEGKEGCTLKALIKCQSVYIETSHNSNMSVNIDITKEII